MPLAQVVPGGARLRQDPALLLQVHPHAALLDLGVRQRLPQAPVRRLEVEDLAREPADLPVAVARLGLRPPEPALQRLEVPAVRRLQLLRPLLALPLERLRPRLGRPGRRLGLRHRRLVALPLPLVLLYRLGAERRRLPRLLERGEQLLQVLPGGERPGCLRRAEEPPHGDQRRREAREVLAEALPVLRRPVQKLAEGLDLRLERGRLAVPLRQQDLQLRVVLLRLLQVPARPLRLGPRRPRRRLEEGRRGGRRPRRPAGGGQVGVPQQTPEPLDLALALQHQLLEPLDLGRVQRLHPGHLGLHVLRVQPGGLLPQGGAEPARAGRRRGRRRPEERGRRRREATAPAAAERPCPVQVGPEPGVVGGGGIEGPPELAAVPQAAVPLPHGGLQQGLEADAPLPELLDHGLGVAHHLGVVRLQALQGPLRLAHPPLQRRLLRVRLGQRHRALPQPPRHQLHLQLQRRRQRVHPPLVGGVEGGPRPRRPGRPPSRPPPGPPGLGGAAAAGAAVGPARPGPGPGPAPGPEGPGDAGGGGGDGGVVGVEVGGGLQPPPHPPHRRLRARARPGERHDDFSLLLLGGRATSPARCRLHPHLAGWARVLPREGDLRACGFSAQGRRGAQRGPTAPSAASVATATAVGGPPSRLPARPSSKPPQGGGGLTRGGCGLDDHRPRGRGLGGEGAAAGRRRARPPRPPWRSRGRRRTTWRSTTRC